MRWSIRNSCRWASKIVAVSENTKRDLISLYAVPEEKIEVIHEGISHPKGVADNRQWNSKSQINSKHQISKPYFLFIGRIEARKNVARIVEAFDAFKKKCSMGHTLVLAGKPGYGYDDIKSQIATANFQNDIVELGYVSEEEKYELLRNAEECIFPSLYEGFGLPVLEAQAIGVPVLTSNTSSLVEVAGRTLIPPSSENVANDGGHVGNTSRGDTGGAIFVDPMSVDDIARGIEKIALDSDFRSAIIKNGLKNVTRFSWETCAMEIAELLKGK